LDTLTRFTAGIIYLLYRSYKSITILRPFTLDPASPERFLVCHNLKYPVNVSILQHLDNLLKYEKIENILEVVPLKCLLEPQFQQYMADENQRLLQREIQALDKRLWYDEHKNDQQVCQTFDIFSFHLIYDRLILQ
jgi:cap1 methyltransferase